MPTYAYLCKDCGEALEVQQAFSDESLTTCPKCQGTLRKQFGAVGVVFKGSGFYSNDSRAPSTSKKNAPGKNNESSAGSEGSKETSGGDSASSASTSTESTSKDSSSSTSAAKSSSSSTPTTS